MSNEIVHQIEEEYKQALATGGAAADALRGATKVIASRMFQRGSVILEFLQNAEDAKAPEFSIDLTPGRIIFENNGNAFSDSDVRSLCSIGNSAKLVSGGYLGYFGIGFKSAFRISDKVEVFSGDYSFKFERQCWKEPNFPWQIVPLAFEGTPCPKGARFICTLHSGEKGKRSIQSLSERAEHLGRAFMFLKKVQKLEWHDTVNGKTITFTKAVESESEVLGEPETRQQELTLHLGSATEKWLLFRRVVPVPQEIREAPETNEAGREQLTEREVVVGFQIAEDGKLKKAPGASIYGGIFSHLPLTAEQANLPFIIQGDFVSEGGRDALDEAHPWNHWMLRSAADLLTDMAEVFKSHAAWRYQFLDLMLGQAPATASVKQHFFDRLVTSMKDHDVVLADDDHWVKPTSGIVQENTLDDFCMAIGSTGLQKVFTPDKWFINPKIVNRTAIRDRLNTARFTTKECMALLSDPKWDLFLKDQAKVENAPIWFHGLYRALQGLLPYQASAYRARPWVLTADSTTVIGKEARLQTGSIENVPDSLLNFVLKCCPDAIVHPGVLQDGDNGKDDLVVRTFLKAIDVGDATLDWFVEKKLLLLMETEQWQRVPETEKTNALRVIFKWFSSNPKRAKGILTEWKASAKLQLPTKKKGLWRVAGQLYLPTECGCKLEGLLTSLGGHPESFANGLAFSSEGDTEGCTTFLLTTGVGSDLRIIPAQTIAEAKLTTELAPEVRQRLLGKQVEYQTIEFLEAVLGTWSLVDGEGLFSFISSLWEKGGNAQSLFKSPNVFIQEENGGKAFLPGWSPLVAVARLGNWVPTNEGLRSPLTLHQRPAFCIIETDKAIVHGLAPLLQAELAGVTPDFLTFCEVRDTRQGLEEDDLILLLSLLSRSAWAKEQAETRVKTVFKRLSGMNNGISKHEDVPVMICSGSWMPVGQTYISDCDEATLFHGDLPFAWIPQDQYEECYAVLLAMGAHSAAKELAKRNTALGLLGTYPFMSALLELAAISGAKVERYGYLALTVSLDSCSKDKPEKMLVEDVGGVSLRIMLHKDFAAGDTEIGELAATLSSFVPGVNLDDVDRKKVVERVAIEEATRREVEEKEQNLTKAAIGSGFDYHSLGTSGDYKVEVKGCSDKGDITLIGEEPKAAGQYGTNYHLYVVYKCRSPEPQVKQTVDPVAQWEIQISKTHVVPEKKWSAW